MNKHLRLLPLVLIPLVLGSCNHGKSESSSVESNNTSTSIVESLSQEQSSSSEASSSSQDSSSSSSSSSSTPTDEVVIGEVYQTNYWDNKVQKMIEMTLGDLSDKVPAFITTRYEAMVDEAKDGNDKFLVFDIKCFNPNAASATRLYREKMVELGYSFDANGIGYLMKDYYSDLFLSYDVVDGDAPYFHIMSTIRKTREATWDKSFIDMYAAMEIPSYDAPAYDISYDSSSDKVIVYALFTGTNAISEYETILQKAGYVFNAQSTLDMPIYTDPTGYVTVQLYQTYGDYNCNALYIAIDNSWPQTSIISFIGITDFPKLVSDTASFDGYGFYDEGKQGKDEDIVLLIYYINVTEDEFYDYAQYLIDLGFEAGELKTSEAGVMSVQLTGHAGGYTLPLVIAYSAEANGNGITPHQLCIAIYQQY